VELEEEAVLALELVWVGVPAEVLWELVKQFLSRGSTGKLHDFVSDRGSP